MTLPPPPFLITRQTALANGLTRDQIRQRVRSGRWRRVAAGVYDTAPTDPPDDRHVAERADHLRRARAALLAHPGCVLAFASAALAFDLPLVSGTPPLVEVVQPDGARGRVRDGVRFREGRLALGDVVEHEGLLVTSPQRTWIDIARTHRLPDALSAGDRAVAQGLLDVEDARWAIRQLGSARGVRLSMLALAHVDGRRESPLESWSHATFVAWSLPLPVPQVEVRDSAGLIGRVDFAWSEHGVVGEADGRAKYDSPEALYAEKRREDRLRALGLAVVRWGWVDLAERPDALRQRLAAALRNSPTPPGSVGQERPG